MSSVRRAALFPSLISRNPSRSRPSLKQPHPPRRKAFTRSFYCFAWSSRRSARDSATTIGSTNAKPDTRHEVTAVRAGRPSGRTVGPTYTAQNPHRIWSLQSAHGHPPSPHRPSTTTSSPTRTLAISVTSTVVRFIDTRPRIFARCPPADHHPTPRLGIRRRKPAPQPIRIAHRQQRHTHRNGRRKQCVVAIPFRPPPPRGRPSPASSPRPP